MEALGRLSSLVMAHLQAVDAQCHVMQAARPKLEMELPYKMYRLVKADGTLCERIDKHPFAMSRCRLCNPRQVLCDPHQVICDPQQSPAICVARAPGFTCLQGCGWALLPVTLRGCHIQGVA